MLILRRPVLTLSSLLITCSVAACGTSSGEGGAAGSLSGADGGDASSPVADSGAPGDPGDATPTVTDASDIPDRGAAPTPGSVACGNAGSCDAHTSTCCLQTGDTDAGGSSCLLGTSAACPAYEHVALHCDHAANCAAGQVCCRAPNGDSACATTCATTEMQMCRTHSECLDGEPCTFQNCPGFRRVEACGRNPACIY